MAGLPICHPALEVAVLGFRPWSLAEDEAGGEGSGPGWLGVVLTPWMLSIALLPAEAGAWDRLEPGRRRELELPAGRFLFQAGNLEDFGGLWLSSLISPMAGFSGQAMALDAAQAALEAVLTVPPPPPPAALSRRALFGARPLASRLGEPLPGGPAAHA
jgi:[NiFe] hydrogenase assembly HybE family chaperone